MKKLVIVRHAKSSWDDESLSDFDRPLNHRGERDAPRMAKRLKEKRVFPDIMISSPANRALTTCRVMAGVLGFDSKKIRTEKKLYHASAAEIRSVLRELPDLNDDEEVVMLFGHNPGLTEFVNLLLNETIDNVPTCGVVGCTISIEKWNELNWGSGVIDYFDFPKK